MFKQRLKSIKTALLGYGQSLKQFAQVWPEMFSIPLALVVWLVSPYVIYFLDSEAATFDSGILQVYAYVMVGMMVFNGLVFAGIKFNFPVVFEFYKTGAGKAFNELTQWQKILVLLILYVGLFLCCVWLASIMVTPTHHA